MKIYNKRTLCQDQDLQAFANISKAVTSLLRPFLLSQTSKTIIKISMIQELMVFQH